MNPTLTGFPSRAQFFQSPLYGPGGVHCAAASNVDCVTPMFYNTRDDMAPQELGGHTGQWNLAMSDANVATATNCPANGQIACSYPEIGFTVAPREIGTSNLTITGNQPGDNAVLPISVTQTSLVITINSVPYAQNISASVDCPNC